MACRTGCPTQDHANWGDCARAASIQIDRHALAGHRPLERDKDKRLSEYESLRNDGLQPKSTRWKDIRATYEYGGVKPTEVVQSGSNVQAAD